MPDASPTNGAAKEAAHNIEPGRSLGDNMSYTMLQQREAEESAEQKLWRAVIATTVEEWINGPLRRQREAERFLFIENEDYRTVCQSAGINPEDLRGRLEKIRARQNAEAKASALRN
jgi:hypothetical protein